MKPDDKKIWEIVDRNEDQWRKKKKRSEDSKTVDAVIDLNTVKQLKRLQTKGFLSSITGTIASGKEAGVFLAELGPEGKEYCKAYSIMSPIVVKIFRTSTLNFKRIIRYIQGDMRFRKHSKKTHRIINLWAEKEYSNLQRSSFAEINVPKPILIKNNILLMELLGKDGKPYPLLKYTPEAFTQPILTQILDQMKLLFQRAGLVHADLSPFNILIGNQTPYFIDMSQSVLVSHPKAFKFLIRDLKNVLSFFSGKEFEIPDTKELFDEIIKDFPDKNLIAGDQMES
ncbi:MAG: serine protein kinase RIO [Candidatus Hodarchaeales archaeon]|jgi:RIO kinase 1